MVASFYTHLTCSQLIIFKGDLHYRKLVADRQWDPVSSDIVLATGAFCPAPFVSLRTLKAPTLAGPMDAAVVQALNASCPEWMVNGDYALVQFRHGAGTSRANWHAL
jgi:hypothetical protein